MANAASTLDLGAQRSAAIFAKVRRKAWGGFAVLAVVFLYLAYTWNAFDVSGLLAKAEPDRALILGTDSVAHKVHVTKSLRSGELEIAIEGERTSRYQTPPPWVALPDDERALIDLGEGHTAEIVGNRAIFEVPGYGTIVAEATEDGVETTLPGPQPEWMRLNPRKFDARPTLGKRVQVSRSKIEVHRY